MSIVFDEVEGTIETPCLQPSQKQETSSAAAQEVMDLEQFYVLHEQELRRFKRLRAD